MEETFSPKISALLGEYWDWKVREYPQDASWNGIHTFSDRLTDISMDAFNDRYSRVLKFLDKVEDIETSVSSYNETLTLKFLKYELNSFKDGHKLNGYYIPIIFFWRANQNLMTFLDRMPLNSMEEYTSLISKMGGISHQMDQAICLMKAGMAVGIAPHRIFVYKQIHNLTTTFVDNPSESPFYKYFSENFPSTLSEQEKNFLQEKARDVIRHKVTPAFRKLWTFLDEEYKPRENVAITSLPNGKEFYRRLIQVHSSSTLTPEEAHAFGLSEIDRISQEMRKIFQEIGFSNKSLKEVANMIDDDPTNFYESEKELMKAVEDIIQKAYSKLPKLFKRIPTYQLKLQGNAEASITKGIYHNPPLDGSAPALFILGVGNPKGNPKFSLVNLVLHETVPGHHLQYSHMMEFGDLPMFRKVPQVGNMLRTYPSGFSVSSGYTEGWALYAETLGFEMGMFNDPLDRFGHYNDQLLRSCRVVFDTGLHALGWTREQAIEFLQSNAAISFATAESEIDRSIAIPGHGLSYKIGEMRFLQMREKAETKLKSNFDIKEYHDALLSVGNGPLDIIEEAVDKFIENQLNII